jgi:uncharacterized protein
VLPPRSPNLNAYAERWVRSVKEERLSKVVLFGERSLRRALREYIEHFHAERNHQGKGNVLLFPRDTNIRRERPVQCEQRPGLAMKWDMPIRPSESGPLTRREIKELERFLLAEDLKNPMDFFTFDGFICAVLSGPNTIMPSQWLRWVWDQEEGEQPPEFTSEKQAKRILSLLIGHANVVAFTLTHGPQHYEPRFYAHKIEGNGVPIIDEWCCGYVKGIALDPEGWQPLIDARPDWFEVIHLYGTKSGWERLKQLVDAHEDSVTGSVLPCPCGSGKKFKRCHGAPDIALH